MNDRELEAGVRAWYGTQVGEAETAPLSLRRDVAAIPAAGSHRSRLLGRGRGLTLLAAAALVLGGTALAAGSGLLRLLVPAPSPISLDTPAEVQAFVFSSYERLSQLPPESITTLDGQGRKDRIYVDRSGAVRIERYASADATEPTTSMLLGGNRFGRTLTVGSDTVWVEQDEAIGEDPRVYLRALSGLVFSGGSDCAMTLSDAGDGSTATGWRSVGAETVAGRPAHHFACGGGDMWLDDETRLVLRVRQPATDAAGNPVPGAFNTTEVTKIEFGDQPAALFDFSPPNGVAAMPLDTYDALCRPGQDTVAFLDYPLCSGTPPVAAATPTPAPTPSPTPSGPPSSSDCALPSPDQSAPAGPLTWAQASVKLDWPAPIRPEPAGGASAAPMPPTYIDPSGDDGSNGRSCADIRDVTADSSHVDFDLMSSPPHEVNPSKAWIAYGVVVDDNGDGIADWRYGIDDLPQIPGDAAAYHRAWRTNLHTGRTDYDAGPRIDHWLRGDPLGEVGDTQFGTNYPAASASHDVLFRFYETFDVAGAGQGSEGAKFDVPFYVWASEIVDGRVVATDFAPDTGWLIPTPDDANPGGTYVVPGVVGAQLPFRLTVNVPNGWTTNGPLVSPKHTGDENTGLEFMIVDHPAEWGCDASGNAIEPPIGPTVDDLVTFLEREPMIRISTNSDVTVGGYRGKYLEYTTTVNDDNCHGPEWPLDTRQPGNVGFTQEWILDVNGVRLVIDGFAPQPSDPVKAELTRIVESIAIGP
jgi:hypothetical protein